MAKLTKNFSLEELQASTTATALKIKNVADSQSIINLVYLAVNVLQPLRNWWGKSIAISSGYRNSALNKAVGGVSNSQHTNGQAADLCLPTLANGKQDLETGKRWFNYIRNNLTFDQLIWEHDKYGKYWIHVSFNFEWNRRQVIDNLTKK